MIIFPIEGTAQLVAGEWSINTPTMIGILKQIVLESADTSNSFIFTITNKNNLTMYPRDNESNSVVENKMNKVDLNIPLNGKYTLAISNATVAGDTVKYLIQVQEKA